jgi:AbrB family looped-hinge helix DNA binding protein
MKKATLGLNGRIVIPKSIRKEMNIETGSPLIITYKEGAVVVRAEKSMCGRCGSPVEFERTLRLCDKCIEEVLKNHSSNSKN